MGGRAPTYNQNCSTVGVEMKPKSLSEICVKKHTQYDEIVL